MKNNASFLICLITAVCVSIAVTWFICSLVYTPQHNISRTPTEIVYVEKIGETEKGDAIWKHSVYQIRSMKVDTIRKRTKSTIEI